MNVRYDHVTVLVARKSGGGHQLLQLRRRGDDYLGGTWQTVRGTMEAGATLTILSDGGPVGSTIAGSSSYSLATSALTDGTYNFTVTATSFGTCTSAPKSYSIQIGTGGCPTISLPASLPVITQRPARWSSSFVASFAGAS